MLDDDAAEYLGRTFQSLANPTRLRLISALASGDLCVQDLAGILGMTQSAVSHQLRILRDLRLIKPHKNGRVVYYSLDDEHIRMLYVIGLEHYEHRP